MHISKKSSTFAPAFDGKPQWGPQKSADFWGERGPQRAMLEWGVRAGPPKSYARMGCQSGGIERPNGCDVYGTSIHCARLPNATRGVLAHLVERNNGIVEVRSSSLLCSTKRNLHLRCRFFCVNICLCRPRSPSNTGLLHVYKQKMKGKCRNRVLWCVVVRPYVYKKKNR